jgi:uncharacterized repeat protein (TIGR01451 family)
MSRTTMATISGLLTLGCVVAWLPAQESSRRTANKTRASVEESTPPSLLPDGNLPPIVPPPTSPPGGTATGNLRSQYSPIGQQLTREGAEQSPATLDDAAAVDAADDSQLRSVLKRSGPASVAAPPPALAPVSSPPAELTPGQLPRRGVASVPPASTSAAPQSRNAVNATNSATPRPGTVVSAGGKSAALKAEITGPQGVTVGKPAPYTVTLTNESDAAADEVQVRVLLPAFVTVLTTQPTSGEAGVQGDAAGQNRLVWNLPRVAGRSHQTLKLQLVTREGDAFDLGVEWTCKPAAARASIVVKQPQLDLSLAGPSDMVFGEEKTFTLSVSNPGSGDAEHVMVSVAAGNSPPTQFDAGTIPAGHKKEVPLAVVASQPGVIELVISALAEGGLEATTAGKITVRKAEVTLAIEGPPLKYAGSEAVYVVAVGNSGTAAADNVNLSLTLPAGAKYLGGIEGATTAGSGLKWKIVSLPAGAERTYEVRLQMTTAGVNQLVVQSQATASGTATAAAETEVQAVSDLKLLVNDPSGPLPTSELAVYELQVTNRGSEAARQVKIIVQFSDGVEPVAFEGCEARIVPGQVLCQPLLSLGPGEQAMLRIKAKAEQAGTHQFRVEVTTNDGDARLVSEGTTRFFADSGRGGATSTARKPGSSTTVR